MRTLYFEQITDDRINDNIRELLENRVNKLKEILNIDGIELQVGNIYDVDFGTSKQCRCKFYIRKTTRKITWNDIYRIVNSVKPVPYSFI